MPPATRPEGFCHERSRFNPRVQRDPARTPARHIEFGPGQLFIPQAPPLAPIQLQAAQLLAAGHRLSDIARTLSLSRATLYRWQQAPDFAAYFNQLVRQRTDEALAASSCLMVDSLSFVRETMADPKTPLDRRLNIAFRMMALYARPTFLKLLTSLSDDPRAMAEAQCRQSFTATGQPIPPEGFAEDEIAFFSCTQDTRLEQTEILEANLHNQEPLPRDTMRQNEAPAACTSAIDAALTGLRQDIALATTSFGVP